IYVVFLAWCYQYHFVEINNAYLYWLLLFVAEDFVFYVLHVVDHYCRFFWAVHVTHHSSEYFNLTTGFRSSVFQPLYRFVYFIPLVLVGFKPADIILMYAITQTYGIIVHTNYFGKMAWLGWLRYIFVTPSHHRVHHASNVAYLDKNMGMCLIVWDRLFGTFQEELDDEPIRYGLTKPLDDNGLTNTIFHEWKAIFKDLQRPIGWTTKIKYLLSPPGWSHDGSSLTSNQLREQMKQKNSAGF
ncbi:MAG: sterol desaturase family protein, partial [Spirosomaceae bacterium]|nr:sterol desaturase family protein [Spirosomataceae bacterium]